MTKSKFPRFQEVKLQLRQWHVTITRRAGEYRVNVEFGGEASAYYTEDLEDALATGLEMGRTHRPIPMRQSAKVFRIGGEWFKA